MKITKEELASKLNGMEYGSEIPIELNRQAIDNKLVIAYGYSDDLLEIEGAICDEGNCYGGGKFLVCRSGEKIDGYDEDDDKYISITLKEDGIVPTGDDSTITKNLIEAVWCDKTHEPFAAWTLKTTIPHAKFNIKEDEDIQSIGIIFSLDDLEK